jgi:hypothetical protein
VACDRFLRAPLSRFQARALLAERLHDFRGPALPPGLQDPATFPRLGLREEKTGGIGALGVLMPHDQPLTPIALQPHDFCKGPLWLGVTVATPYPYRAETLWVPVPEGRRHRIDLPPLPLPGARPCAFELTDPVFPRALHEAGELQGHEAVVKGLRGRRQVPCLCALRDALQRSRGPLPLGPLVELDFLPFVNPYLHFFTCSFAHLA